jgi:hypothetical protein
MVGDYIRKDIMVIKISLDSTSTTKSAVSSAALTVKKMAF